MAFGLGGEINGSIAPAAGLCGASLLIAKDKILAVVQSLMCGRSALPRAFGELKGRMGTQFPPQGGRSRSESE